MKRRTWFAALALAIASSAMVIVAAPSTATMTIPDNGKPVFARHSEQKPAPDRAAIVDPEASPRRTTASKEAGKK